MIAIDPLTSWWDSPEASATICIAIVAGIFALYQLRSLPAERRRNTLDAMVQKWASSKDRRGIMLEGFPALMEYGTKRIASSVDEALLSTSLDSANRQHLTQLRSESQMWINKEVEMCFTGAHEILTSEFRVRCLLWSVETIRHQHLWGEVGLTHNMLENARATVDQVNDFGLDYENGVYPPRTMFGQFHISLVRIAKALEPVIWEGRGNSGRWGRRVVRLGLAAEHYNDVTAIHRISDIYWPSRAALLHPAITTSVFGKEIVDSRVPENPRLFPILRIRARESYWRFVGWLRLRPRRWTSYGGRRLRAHRKAEAKLVAIVAAVQSSRFSAQDSRRSLDFTWDLEDVDRHMKSEVDVVRTGMRITPLGSGSIPSR